jgi:hypothetical protein
MGEQGDGQPPKRGWFGKNESFENGNNNAKVGENESISYQGCQRHQIASHNNHTQTIELKLLKLQQLRESRIGLVPKDT